MKNDRAPALTEGLRILEMVIAADFAVPFESILNSVQMSRSSVSRLLKVLVAGGYLLQPSEGGYLPGLRSYAFLDGLKQSSTSLSTCRTEMERLAEQTQTSIQVGLYDPIRRRGQIIARAMAEDALNVGGSGYDFTHCAHRHALGKVMLAFLSKGERSAMLKQLKPLRRASRTIMPGAALNRHLEEIRKNGFARDFEEAGDHICRVGLPILNPENDLVTGSIAASWVAVRFDDKRARGLLEALNPLANILAQIGVNTLRNQSSSSPVLVT